MSALFDLGATIKAHRLEKHETRQNYAKLVGVGVSTLASLEDDRHYANTMYLRVLDKFLTALHLTREQFDPDFGNAEEARRQLIWAKNQGLSDREIAAFLGIGAHGMQSIWRFLGGEDVRITYLAARTALALADEDFRPYVEEHAHPERIKKEPKVLSGNTLHDALVRIAKDMGFVSWELQHARLVGNVLHWMSGNGTYHIELTQKDFRAYYAKTNTLSVYREFRKKIDEPPPKTVKKAAAKVNPIAHSKQAEARDMASNMFSAMFKKG